MAEHECTCRNCGGREKCIIRFERLRICCSLWRPKSIWIPCSERMPEVGIPVLIYDKHHKAFFVAKLDEDYFGFSSTMWHHPADVPFWMPLPEAPREDRENA